MNIIHKKISFNLVRKKTKYSARSKDEAKADRKTKEYLRKQRKDGYSSMTTNYRNIDF